MLHYVEDRVNTPKDSATQVIREAYEHFKSQKNVSLLGAGYSEILGDVSLYEEFVDAISEGLDADSKPSFKALCENMRLDTLQEASLGGISPVASLQGSMLRKFFPRLVIKDSMPMEVAEKPVFWLPYMTPYYVDRNGTRHALPKYTRDGFAAGNLEATTGLLPIYSEVIGKAALADLNALTGKDSAATPAAVTDTGAGAIAGSSLATAMAAAVVKAGSNDKLDPVFGISTVRIAMANGYDTEATTTPDSAADTLIDVAVDFKADVNGNIFGAIDVTTPASGNVDTATMGDGYVVTNSVAVGASGTFVAVLTNFADQIPASQNIKGHVTGHVDFMTGQVYIAFVGSSKLAGCAFTGYVSSENNNYGGSVEFDIQKREVNIGTGEHVNAAIPVEYTKDLMSMYNIDGHVKTVDLMSTYLAQKTEYEGYNFMKKSFVSNKLGTGGAGYAGSFNCFPAREFAGRPQDWIEELKRLIDYYSAKMRNDSSYPGGSFVVYGNPIDMNLISNVTWSFRTGAGTEREGVEVNYSVGNYQGANLYRVIASENLPTGEIRIFFYPSQEDQMTYKYFPYAFNVEQGYRDPNKPNVPSIMMTKRHTFQEFTPLQTVITVTNNTGALPERS